MNYVSPFIQKVFLFGIKNLRTTQSAPGWIHRCRTGGEEEPCTWCVCVLSRSVGYQGFAGGANGKESTCQCRRHKRHGFNPWVRKILWRKKWQPTPVLLLGKIPQTQEPGRLQSMGSQKSWMQLCYWALRHHRGHMYGGLTINYVGGIETPWRVGAPNPHVVQRSAVGIITNFLQMGRLNLRELTILLQISNLVSAKASHKILILSLLGFPSFQSHYFLQ